ncbi:hypothetical protein NMG60_11016743 [Bertholletia excelsa]
MGLGEEDNHQPLLTSAVTEEEEEEEDIHGVPGQPINKNLIVRTLSESQKIWHIALPSIFSRLAMFSVTIITHDLDLAAISIVTTVLIGITFGFLVIPNALETLCGQAFGAKQYQMLGIYMQRSWVVLFISSLLMLLPYVFATPILKFTGQSPAVAERAGTVALWLVPMHLSFAFQFSLLRFLQCQLKTSVVAWVSVGVLALHVFVSWVFVYRLRVGIVGTAVGVQILGRVSQGKLLLGCGSFSSFLLLLGLCSRCSLSLSLSLSLENFYYRVLIIVSGNMENAEIALDALSICITIFAWESMIPLGFFAATGVRVANELGAGNGEGAKFATIISVFTTLLVGLLFWALIIAIPDKLAMIFTSNTSVIAMVKELAVMLAFTILLNCFQPVLSGVAVGSGWQASVAFVNLGSYYIVGVPMGIILGCKIKVTESICTEKLCPQGVWAGMISGTVVQTLILAIMTTRCKWEKEVQKARFAWTSAAVTN